MIQIALFQPEIAQNVGTLLRFGACLGIPIHVIEPCGFLMSDQKLRRAGMDYAELANLTTHTSWNDFIQSPPKGRLIATSPMGSTVYTDFEFHQDDILLLGMESTGLPQDIMDVADTTIQIPMLPDRRSLNLALSAGIIASEALRQTGNLPKG